ncbi:MAG: ABC transporter ATP-binding protein/permease [Defluviitaleaceae bacterium]|nr:ABC transporter ATP-binding protein/permease [Defluviitaleaceae bacterium]
MEEIIISTKFKKFLSYYKPYKGLFSVVLLCSFLVAALALVLPILVRHITGTVLVSGNDNILGDILRVGAAMLAIIVMQTAVGIFYAYKGHDVGAKMERNMRGELFGHFQKLPFSFYDNQKVGSLMTRMSNDLTNISEMLHHTPEDILMFGTQFFGSLIILFVINVQLTLVICVLLVAMVSYSFPFYRKMQKVIRKNREIVADVNDLVQENLSGIRVVKSFAAEDAELAKFARQNKRHYLGKKTIYKYEAWNYEPVQFFFRPLITIAIVVAGGIQIYYGNLSAVDLLIFIMYAAYLTEPIPQLAFIVSQIQDGFISFIRFQEIMDIVPDIQDANDAVHLQSAKGDLHFKDVGFRYNQESGHVLRHVNLSVAPGETVAIVGRSGIGKTTLCSLIPRFYDVCEGSITIDGVDIRNITQQSLRRQIGVVRQETFLFAGSIMDNILYGKDDAMEAEAIEAAKKANAHDFIMDLPNGYHTNIGQRGIKLSGGQQQRISIARVFLKNPPMLIFDEATSALDYESEQAVMESLMHLAVGRTTFIIAHRLSTIHNADRIIVMGDGCIAEQGTHAELCAMNGEYAKLYNVQQ